jgi:hypothetical protein
MLKKKYIYIYKFFRSKADEIRFSQFLNFNIEV